MSSEIKQLLKLNIETFVIKKYKVFDLFGSTDFTLSSVTFSLRRRSDGVEIVGDSGTVNNNDTDRAGNAIKTVSFNLDLRQTDPHDLGSYYLLINTTLTTEQTDIFRVPTELVDYRAKGIA